MRCTQEGIPESLWKFMRNLYLEVLLLGDNLEPLEKQQT